MTELLIVFCTVLAGSLLQRVSGMGMGLVSVPILSLLIGPVEGVLVVNILACINAIMITATVREYVDWKKFSLISSVLIVGAIPAAYLVKNFSAALLQISVGALLLAALAIVVFGQKFIPPMQSNGTAIISGILGGFMNTLAGIAGPAVTIYAVASRWDQRAFAATLQPIFVVAAAISFLVKITMGAGSLATTQTLIWPVSMIGMLIGIWLGIRFAEKIPRQKARTLSLLVATAGGVSALLRGILTL